MPGINTRCKHEQSSAIIPLAPAPAPECRRYERCEGCPYPRHGFVCWNQDGSCLRTEMKTIYRRKMRNENTLGRTGRTH